MSDPLPRAGLPAIPYPGIEPFSYAEREVFFARNAEARRLIRLIALYRGVLLYAASGIGKSSLVNAGVIPKAIEEGYRPERLRVQPRPGQEILVERIPGLPSILAFEGEERTVLSAEAFLETVRARAAEAHPLLVFDQFEEWVTLFAESRECKTRVLEALAALIQDPQLPVKILIVFREDYLAPLQPLFERCPDLPDHFLRLTPLDGEALQRAIRGPFEKHPGVYRPEIGEPLAKEIARQIVERAGEGGGAATEAQIVCRTLFESGDPGRTFAESNGVQGILERYLEGALASLGPGLRDPAVALLSRMVTSAGTRNVISRDDLLERVALEEQIPRERLSEALERLESGTHLVRREMRREVWFYEIASEFLVGWIGRQAERLRVARGNRRLRRILASLAAILLVVGAFAVFALIKWREADRQKQLRVSQLLAEESRGEESISRALLLSVEAIRRSRLAGETSSQAERSLRIVFLRSSGHVLGKEGRPVLDAAMTSDGRWLAELEQNDFLSLWRMSPEGLPSAPVARLAFPGPLGAIAVSPDASWLAVVNDTRSVFLWRLTAEPQPRLVLSTRNPVDTVLFSGDGRWLVAAGGDEPSLWSLDRTPSGSGRLLAEDCGATHWSHSGTSRWIAVGCDDGRTILWDLRDREPVRQVLPPDPAEEEISALAFRDESRLAIGSKDGTIRFQGLKAPVPAVPWRLPAEVTGLAFQPNGKWLAARLSNGQVQLYDAGPGSAPGDPEPSIAISNFSLGLIWSGNGHWLLAFGPLQSDLFELAPSGKLVPAGELKATTATFSPDNRWLVTGALNQVQRVDLQMPENVASFQGAEGMIQSLTFGLGNRLLCRAYKQARLFEIDAGEPERGDEPEVRQGGALPDPLPSITSQSPDGKWRLTITGDLPILTPAGGHPIPLRRHLRGVTVTDFSRNGHWLITGGRDGHARLWDLHRIRALAEAGEPAEPESEFSHVQPVAVARFSPDGRWLVTTSEDAAVLWRLGDARSSVVPLIAKRSVNAHFSPDSRWLAIVYGVGYVHLWDLSRPVPEASGLDLPSRRTVRTVQFDTQSRRLRGADEHGNILTWRLRLDDLVDLACRTAGRNLTEKEWLRYLGVDEPYEPTCPGLVKKNNQR
jgi:WD40 repeat protein